MNKKENRGITLVALVITIIVLIILAGVSINAVMNDGLIGNAKNARDDYEDAKRKEEIALIDLEVQTDFLNAGTPYNFSNGYLTGVFTGESGVVPESVAELSQKLPKGYSVLNVDGTGIDNTNIYVTTGMIIQKGDNELGRIIIYGDIDWEEEIDATDSSLIQFYVDYKQAYVGFELIPYEEAPQYWVLAMDVDHNNIINLEDANLITRISILDSGEKVDQNVPAPSFDDIVVEFAE